MKTYKPDFSIQIIFGTSSGIEPTYGKFYNRRLSNFERNRIYNQKLRKQKLNKLFNE